MVRLVQMLAINGVSPSLTWPATDSALCARMESSQARKQTPFIEYGTFQVIISCSILKVNFNDRGFS